MDTIHAIFRSDLMSGTQQAADMVSVKLTTQTDNGNFIHVGGLIEGEYNVFEGKTPTATTGIDNVIVLHTPELMYDERKTNLNEFTNEAEGLASGYRLRSGNIFSVTKEGLDGKAVKGHVVELQAGTKGKVVATATAGSTKIGTIIAIENEYIVIQIG